MTAVYTSNLSMGVIPDKVAHLFQHKLCRSPFAAVSQSTDVMKPFDNAVLVLAESSATDILEFYHKRGAAVKPA